MEGFKLAGHTGVEYHPNHGGNSKGQVLDAQQTETHPFQESADEFTVIDHVPFSMSSDRQGYLGAMIEKATTKITNMYFQVIDESTKMNLAQLLSSEFVMLGRKITNIEEAVKVVQDLVYFSYRKFDYPIVYKGRKLYTDNLWGCTLRAAQMLFAVLYKRVYPTAAHNDIIELFKEYKEPEKGPFSILRICEVGSTSYTGRPGEYWNCLTSMLSLKDLFFAQPGVSSMLSFLCFHNNMISFGEFAKSDFGTDEVMVLGETEADDIDVFHTKKLVYFVGLLGDQRICEENYQCLKLLMDLPTFCGMLGGVGTKAHYVYGYNKDMLLYLDPHMAQVDLVKPRTSIRRQLLNTKLIKSTRTRSTASRTKASIQAWCSHSSSQTTKSWTNSRTPSRR